MGWSIGYDNEWDRDIGYGVPAYCDHPECSAEIDRGLSYVCCGQQPKGGEHGCGLYFCGKHSDWKGRCERCAAVAVARCPDCNEDAEEDENEDLICPACNAVVEWPDYPPDWSPFPAKADHPRWLYHKLHDWSWAQWRSENPHKLAAMAAAVGDYMPPADDTDTNAQKPAGESA